MKRIKRADSLRMAHADLLHDMFTKVERDYSILLDMINDYNKSIDAFNAALTDAANWLDTVDEWKDTEMSYLDNIEVPHNPTDTAASDASDTLRRLKSD